MRRHSYCREDGLQMALFSIVLCFQMSAADKSLMHVCFPYVLFADALFSFIKNNFSFKTY